ncbi:hypothetical protein [Nocardioides solisilvae]|uniref:hypothetical protein n=1 Tax=Nocardioides solisilvae TaxID=1542435 RepID=UPI0013A555A8|nr:hypothetical protein [Nocardioides solisilvae]
MNPSDDDHPTLRRELAGDVRSMAGDLRDGLLELLVIGGPVVLGAVVGWFVAGTTGLLVGGGIGAAAVALWFAWVAAAWLRDGVRRLRGRS